MDIFFLRHGETEYNRKHLHQPANAPLNEKGRAQAAHAAEYIKQLNITDIVSSEMLRAKETAHIVADELGMSVVESSVLIELTSPRFLIGTKHKRLASLIYLFRWLWRDDQAYWQKQGGESLTHMLERVKQTKEMLVQYPADARVLVVSHSIFINFFVHQLCATRPISLLETTLLFLRVKKLNNSSLTHIKYDKNTESECPWKLVSYDDDEHVLS